MTIVVNGRMFTTGPISAADGKFCAEMVWAINKWQDEGKPLSGRDMK